MSSLTELRVLEGPNLYFPRAAIKLTLDVSVLAHADEDDLRAMAGKVGIRNLRPGSADSGFRQRAIARLVTTDSDTDTDTDTAGETP